MVLLGKRRMMLSSPPQSSRGFCGHTTRNRSPWIGAPGVIAAKERVAEQHSTPESSTAELETA
jgi:hypothetical protein